MKASMSVKLVDAAVSLITFCAGTVMVFALAGIGVIQAANPAQPVAVAHPAARTCMQIGGRASPVYDCSNLVATASRLPPVTRLQLAAARAVTR